jgi:hypothetical protein
VDWVILKESLGGSSAQVYLKKRGWASSRRKEGKREEGEELKEEKWRIVGCELGSVEILFIFGLNPGEVSFGGENVKLTRWPYVDRQGSARLERKGYLSLSSC